jgi:hypothetical protein
LELRQRTRYPEVSMSTSSLYHAFGIRGYQYTRTEYQGGQVIFTIHQEPQTCRCPACGSHDVKPRGHVERRFQSLSGARRGAGRPATEVSRTGRRRRGAAWRLCRSARIGRSTRSRGTRRTTISRGRSGARSEKGSGAGTSSGIRSSRCSRRRASISGSSTTSSAIRARSSGGDTVTSIPT